MINQTVLCFRQSKQTIQRSPDLPDKFGENLLWFGEKFQLFLNLKHVKISAKEQKCVVSCKDFWNVCQRLCWGHFSLVYISYIWVPSDFMKMHSVLLLVICIRLCSLDESEKGEEFIFHFELTIGISKHTFSVLLTPKKHT